MFAGSIPLFFVFFRGDDFIFNAFPLDNSKFLFFSASPKSLRNLAWKILLILVLSGTELFISYIFSSMMANWVHCAYCFHNHSFSFKNSWYLCREHLNNFEVLFGIGNDCSKRLWLFTWSVINLQEVIDILCMLTLNTCPNQTSFHCCLTMI